MSEFQNFSTDGSDTFTTDRDSKNSTLGKLMANMRALEVCEEETNHAGESSSDSIRMDNYNSSERRLSAKQLNPSATAAPDLHPPATSNSHLLDTATQTDFHPNEHRFSTNSYPGSSVVAAAMQLLGGSAKDLQALRAPVKTNSGCLKQLPLQRQAIASRSGVTFTLMVAGESGVGKTTFINTLFGDELCRHETDRRHTTSFDGERMGNMAKTTRIEIHQAEYVENGFTGRFTVVDTPGFGDYTNNQYAWLPIVNFIDAQHTLYMCQEEQPYRQELSDTRVHACLYFIQPSGHGLLPLDIKVMQELGTRVNLIPVIAKADSFTHKSLPAFKKTIHDAIRQHSITIFEPPSDTSLARMDLPFAVISNENYVEDDEGRSVRGRRYRWGVAEVENPDHCDFLALRDLLMGKHMLDLIDTTHEVHYQRQRRMLMLERYEASLRDGAGNNAAKAAGDEVAKKTNLASGNKDRKKVSFQSPLVNDMPGHAVQSALEVIAQISPYGCEYLTNERLKDDQLFLQRVIGTKKHASDMSKMQERKFFGWTSELKTAKISCEAELEAIEDDIKLLEHQVSLLEANKRRR